MAHKVVHSRGEIATQKEICFYPITFFISAWWIFFFLWGQKLKKYIGFLGKWDLAVLAICHIYNILINSKSSGEKNKSVFN